MKGFLIRKNAKTRRPYGHEIPPCVADFQMHIDQIIQEWHAYVKLTNTVGTEIDKMSEDQKELNKDQKWKAFFVFVYDNFNPEAQSYFPRTSELAKKWQKEIRLLFFSSLEPGKHIPPHEGRNHSVIRTQIGIDIAQPGKTGLRVHDKTVQLKNRETFIFDDTFEHEAWNEGDLHRTVLIIDSCKQFPYIYNLINRFLLRKLKKTPYVQSVISRLKGNDPK